MYPSVEGENRFPCFHPYTGCKCLFLHSDLVHARAKDGKGTMLDTFQHSFIILISRRPLIYNLNFTRLIDMNTDPRRTN